MENVIKKYAHITSDTKRVNVELSEEQQALIFYAYDFGLSSLNDVEKLRVLNTIIADLKNAIHE